MFSTFCTGILPGQLLTVLGGVSTQHDVVKDTHTYHSIVANYGRGGVLVLLLGGVGRCVMGYVC